MKMPENGAVMATALFIMLASRDEVLLHVRRNVEDRLCKNQM